MDLQGKVALVTGGGIRVGRALSLGLARAGARVVVHYNRSAGPAEETVAEARRLGAEAVAVQGDFSSAEQVRRVAQFAQQPFGSMSEGSSGVDLLIHAASPFVKGRLFDTDLETWHLLSAVVVESFFLLAQELAPGMRARALSRATKYAGPSPGAMIAILDRGAFEPWPEHLFHGLAKMALWGLVRSLAVELAPEVRVNGLVAGPVLPPPGMGSEGRARLQQEILLKRWGSPQDVIDATLYLARADFVTGSALFVDGGRAYSPGDGGRSRVRGT